MKRSLKHSPSESCFGGYRVRNPQADSEAEFQKATFTRGKMSVPLRWFIRLEVHWVWTSHPHLPPNVVATLSVIPSAWQVEQEDLSLRPSWGYRERERESLSPKTKQQKH